MRKLLRILFLRPVLWATNKFSSKPDRKRIFAALSLLFNDIVQNPGKKGLVIPFEQHGGKFILLSDQHKGRRNGADDFMAAEPNYLAALNYYANNNFFYINLGDSEELWENNLWQVRKKNKETFEAEKKFLAHNSFVKIFGNHDLYWNISPIASLDLKSIYGENIKVYDGVILAVSIGTQTLQIFCTHGHQGDAQSDGNWFSKFFVGWIWGPLQALLRIYPNTPAYNAEKKTLHNSIMYEWSSEQKNMVLITGHTHQPVFKSLTQLEKLYKQFQFAGKGNNKQELETLLNEIKKVEKKFAAVSLDYMSMKPSYFNTGCCCFNDGDITGIEIEDGHMRLIKWELAEGKPERLVLEETELETLVKEL